MSLATPARLPVDAVLFDKDGTLFEFRATWDAWTAALIEDLSAGISDVRERLAAALGYDLPNARLTSRSPVIAGSNREVSELVAAVLGRSDIGTLETDLARRAAQAPVKAAVPLGPLLCELAARGLHLGVMTNDAEFSARAQLRAAGVDGIFDFIAGADSGHGAKPAPDPLLAFARKVRVTPGRVLMVGDSTHDLIAGRAAGMKTIAVLTGVAEPEELAPYADAVLPDIGHIPLWLQG